MSGKHYGVREHKLIVNYLVEHKAYGQIKAKKMWVDFANSQVIKRSWQSLKETFLKRILPDIHNPYYELTTQQIESFRRGFDVEERTKGKLKLRKEMAENSNGTDSSNDVNGEPIYIKSEGEKSTGEDVIAKTNSKRHSNRSSTETIVLEEAYKTAEEIQKILESPRTENDEENTKANPTAKSLRDLITYTEPLTPMLQEVLDDFASESESESQMQIVEDISKESNDQVSKSAENEIVQTTGNNNKNVRNNEDKTSGPININKPFRGTDIKVIQSNDNCEVTSQHDPVVNNNSNNSIIDLSTEKDTEKVISTNIVEKTVTTDKPIENSTQNSSNNTTDSVLPNNQEALNGMQSIANSAECTEIKSTDKVQHKNIGKKKRASSTSSGSSKSKKKKSNQAKKKDENKSKVDANEKENTKDTQEQVKITNEVFDTILENVEQEVAVDTSNNNSKKSIENPCLQSVNLYAESLDEHVGEPQPLNKEEVNVVVESIQNEVVLLNSHSESDTSTPVKSNINSSAKKEKRQKSFANLFGFTSGTVSTSRKGKLSLRKRKTSRHHLQVEDKSGSSEWTSDDSDLEYVSPPRARKNRVKRKYLRPASARILSLEEEGGLFVMYGKKIFPLVKDGKIIKNYLTYSQESDSEGEKEAFWKQKYAEEKQKYDDERKKAEILAELLEKIKEPKQRESSRQPIDIPRKSVSTENNQRKMSTNDNFDKDTSIALDTNKKTSTETVKIKFTKNNEELQVEGQWHQINTVLEQVVKVFHNDTESRSDIRKHKSVSETTSIDKNISRATTPGVAIVDPEVHNKINEIEKEIFEEIELKDQEEHVETVPEHNYVTTRRGKGRKVSSLPDDTPTKKPRISPEVEESNNLKSIKATPTKRSPRTPMKAKSETTVPTSTAQTVQTRNSKTVSASADEDNVRYRLPSRTRQSAPKTDLTKNKSQLNNKSFTMSTLDSILIKSDSMQGYQDSDFSPVINKRKKKRYIRYSTHSFRTKNRNKKMHRFSENITNDSSNSSFGGPLKNTTENSSAYKSDTYRILMSKVRRGASMEVIDEHNAKLKEISDVKHFNVVSLGQSNNHMQDVEMNSANEHSANSDNSSSIVSMPMSPVLPLVENIVVTKEYLSNIKKSLDNDKENDALESFIPCNNEHSRLIVENACDRSKEVRKMSIDESRRRSLSDSFLDKIDRVKIRESSVSDTINMRLGDLLLDSAKKITNTAKEQMEVDDLKSDVIKKKYKKRCSTPRNRKSLTTKLSQITPVIEEHVESYASTGRKSCPPTINIYDCDDNVTNETLVTNKKGKHKKDVIKVKILKPKMRSKSEILDQSTTAFVDKDSEINVMELELLRAFDDNMEFIHNHSDSCINGNECMEDSVEFIRGSGSAISLTTESTESYQNAVFENSSNKISLYGNECDSNHSTNTSESNKTLKEISHNSLITDDLSDETPLATPNSTNWFLLSEDENTNVVNQDKLNFDPNLNKLFPIACAVPNLSTISETSRENMNNTDKASDLNDRQPK